MTTRRCAVIDVAEIFEHWHAGRSKAHVAASVGVDQGKVRKTPKGQTDDGSVNPPWR